MSLQELSSMLPVFHTPCYPSTSASSRSITILLASITKHAINARRVCAAKPGYVSPIPFVREFGLVQLLTCCYIHIHLFPLRLTFFLSLCVYSLVIDIPTLIMTNHQPYIAFLFSPKIFWFVISVLFCQ